MFTVEDLFHRLSSGATGVKRTGAFVEPSATPAASGHTLDQLMALAPAQDDASGAAASEVVENHTFWSLRSGAWGLKTGSLTARTIADSTTNFGAGYFPSTDLRSVDADLAAGNILAGVSFFGIAGDGMVKNTSTGDATANDLVSGKKGYVNGSLITGALSSGSNVSSTSLVTTLPDGEYSGKTVTLTDTNLSAANIRSGKTIFGVTGSAAIATGAATASQVLSGKTFSNASGSGTGAMASNAAATYTPTTSAQTIPQGYHTGSDLVSGDANLLSSNIRASVSLFGVSGATNLLDTGAATAQPYDIQHGKTAYVAGALVTGVYDPGRPPASAPMTGQQQCSDPGAATTYALTACASCTGDCYGQDGMLGVGAGKVYPRFVNNGDGAMRDNLTGLIWLKNANCTTFSSSDDSTTNERMWTNALTAANSLASGYCGLTDGSVAGQWRLPNANELRSLFDRNYTYPALSNNAGTGKWTGAADEFTDVQTNYWTSSTSPYSAGAAIRVAFSGSIESYSKFQDYKVWPVRDSQSASAQAGRPAPVPASGQTGCWDGSGSSVSCSGTGQDGELRKGVVWPNPRFAVSSDTLSVTDKLTGLMWRRDGGSASLLTWADAFAFVTACNTAAYGGYRDWRLPSINELQSLNHGMGAPTVPNTAGTGVWTTNDPFSALYSPYWSSTTDVDRPTYAWLWAADFGKTSSDVKASTKGYAWPVRGGQ
jgi:hypothetical protein